MPRALACPRPCGGEHRSQRVTRGSPGPVQPAGPVPRGSGAATEALPPPCHLWGTWPLPARDAIGCCGLRPTNQRPPLPPGNCAQRCGWERPPANHGAQLRRGAWSGHRPAAPLREDTRARRRKTPSRPDWPAAPPTAPPRAARSLLAGRACQSERSPPLIGRLPLRPAAGAGTAASRRKGVRRAGECRRGRRGVREGGRAGRDAGTRCRWTHRCAAPRGS